MDNAVKIGFTGDLMCQMQQIWAARGNPKAYVESLACMIAPLSSCDYVIGNLETPVAGHRFAFEETRFNAPDAFLEAIREAGFDFLSTANNHCLDRGVRGVDATIGKLDALGLRHTGTYRTSGEAKQPCVLNVKGLRIGVVSCTFETNQGRRSDLLPENMSWKVDRIAAAKPYEVTWGFVIRRFFKGLLPYRLKQFLKDKFRGVQRAGESYLADCAGSEAIDSDSNKPYVESVASKIRQAKSVSDLVVVLPHMGGQYNPEPGPYQKWTVRWMADAGADLIVCNHAHTVLQSETLPNGTFVAYALGNFSLTPGVGYYRRGCQADYSVVLNVWIDAETKKICRKSFSVTENVLRKDGVSVVRPANADSPETKAVVRRFAGKDIEIGKDGEYEL